MEWLAVLGQEGLDFQLDVVDPSEEVADYFEELSRQGEHTFVVFDAPEAALYSTNVIPETFPPRVFGKYATDVTTSYEGPFPRGVAENAWSVTLPKELLRKIHFVRSDVLAPLPGSSYNFVDYSNVSLYLPEGRELSTTHDRRVIDLDLANIVLNMRLGGWLVTESTSDKRALNYQQVAPGRLFDGHLYRVWTFEYLFGGPRF